MGLVTVLSGKVNTVANGVKKRATVVRPLGPCSKGRESGGQVALNIAAFVAVTGIRLFYEVSVGAGDMLCAGGAAVDGRAVSGSAGTSARVYQSVT